MDIKRATRDRWLMGVCGGVAHTTGLNSNLVRLITALLGIIVPGVSVLVVAAVYLVLGFILPESEAF